ncbi:MAG TPA: signal recognition particle-docking protein FtsY [Hyphomonadaceae bacterium]|jgi:fused signal recognition particle receptor|nr:signal recognition particle-docking protein FtsY [Hyphomonadaceae bacterium]HPI47838.1 signal recognition particle-docking protein FtsY [Hyphomonadaceae bacterium]
MILWWGKKKQPDPKTGETPVEPLKPGETPASPIASLDQQIFGNAPIATPEPELGDDPIGLRKAAERIAAERAAEAAAREESVLHKLSEGLRRSSSRLAEGLAGLSKRKIDSDSLDELEELLITSDMGTKVAARITKAFSKDRFDREVTGDEIKAALASEIAAILKPREQVVDFSEGPKPRIVLFVGVNGSGKTTTIGKIAAKLSAQGADIVLAAGDTFRAAAVEQLRVWADRANARFISKPQGADAAGLAYEAVELAKNENRDLVLIDTAGRLQNKTQLMDELAKVVRAIRKIDPTAPHDVILVLDATVGQNALSQVEAFRNTAGVTGLVMTKLDGTAKGGVLVAIAESHALPIHFVGVGEKAEDLHPFSADTFARALVGLDS